MVFFDLKIVNLQILRFHEVQLHSSATKASKLS